ncbi:MAG: hydrogenase maturation protease [Spirulinaceae cyanobacterium SM2_1_0]|nr:hydrogenase maturation protease [Spirulinaceae cyanobacterium SM2_1_0]
MKTLVLGYGNTLRSDDGAGYRLAEIVEAWQLPDVEAWATNQLLPEMAATLVAFDLVIFVDATAFPDETVELTCRPLTAEIQTLRTHYLEPATLLALAQQLYARQPQAYWLLISAENFAFGEQFSARTQAGIGRALEKIVELAGLVPELVHA